jgi:murein DD-endopeptidase MepM/ murein hydrolase activator NlpD
LHRPLSPLLLDYKPSAMSPVRKSKALHWFALGLGLPFLGLALMLSLKNASGTSSILKTRGPTQEPLPQLAMDIPITARPASELRDQAALPDPGSIVLPSELEPKPAYSSIEVTVHRGDTMEQIFRKNKLNLGHLAKIVRLPEAGKYIRMLRPGDKFELQHDHGQLISLYRELSLTSALRISRNESGFKAEIIERPIQIRRRLAYGRIETSLFESAADAGMSDKMIMNLAGIFAWDVDFVLDIRKGDDYYILFEQIYQDEKFVSGGEIIAAEFNNNGRTFRAVRYIDKNGRSDYFTPEGRSVRKAFIRAPVDFTRISSSFNPRRKHPILNTIRAHRGVDYAAPRGTPIKASGDGKVIFRGHKGGYGNAIILQHGGNITTLYGHLSKFANSARLGKRVSQGETIGYVGSTGLATAPHLHYEYRINGIYRNPRTVDLPQAAPIKEEYRADFLAAAAPLLQELHHYKATQIAAAAFD